MRSKEEELIEIKRLELERWFCDNHSLICTKTDTDYLQDWIVDWGGFDVDPNWPAEGLKWWAEAVQIEQNLQNRAADLRQQGYSDEVEEIILDAQEIDDLELQQFFVNNRYRELEARD